MTETPPCHSVLLVEDEPLLAMDMEALLSDAGYRVIGPATTTAEALRLVRSERPDLTLLDLNLGSDMAFAVAEHLADTNAAFVVVSGHSRHMMPERHRDRPFVQKPYNATVLLQTVRRMLKDLAGSHRVAYPSRSTG